MNQLPDTLRILWQGQEYGITNLNVSGMSSIIMLAPKADLDSFRACVVKAQMELHLRATAPVFRLALTFYDQPDAPFAAETFYNVQRDSDRENVELLGRQDELVFHFFEAGSLTYSYSKTISWGQKQRREIWRMLKQAGKHLKQIKTVDFDRAKAEVMAENEV